MDSNETKNRPKELIGPVGYVLLKRQLRNVRLKIDAANRLVTITKDGEKHLVGFDEIEQLVNE